MYTEYVFDNKKYDVVSKELKATIFDIVTQEEANLVMTREKIANTDDEDVRNKLIDICDQQEQYFIRVINSTNELVNSLQILDSYSRELKNMENEHMAQIVASMEQKDDSQEYTDENVDVVDDTNEMEASDDVKDDEEVNTDEDNIDNTNENAEEDVVEDEKSTADKVEQPLIDVNDSENIMESESEPVFKEPDSSEDKENEDTPVSVFDQVDSSENGETDENTQDKEEDNAEISNEEVSTDENSEPVIVESTDEETNSSDGSEQSVDETEEPVVDDENTQSEEPAEQPIKDVVEEKQSEKVSEQPVIDNSESIDPVASETPEQSVDTSSEDVASIVSDSAVENSETISNSASSDIDIPVISDVGSEEAEIPIAFTKADNLSPKVIMTNSSQVTKLRESRDAQESLLTATGFFKIGEVKEETTDVSEQQLIDSGLLPPEEESMEDKIEQMMQQVTQLYNEGKVDEAQKLSDKVSELIQQNQPKKVA